MHRRATVSPCKPPETTCFRMGQPCCHVMFKIIPTDNRQSVHGKPYWWYFRHVLHFQPQTTSHQRDTSHCKLNWAYSFIALVAMALEECDSSKQRQNKLCQGANVATMSSKVKSWSCWGGHIEFLHFSWGYGHRKLTQRTRLHQHIYLQRSFNTTAHSVGRDSK